MSDISNTKLCPYCSEQILITAKKCKHCGEWLEDNNEHKRATYEDRGSSDARAVTKGIKEKEAHDYQLGCFGLIAIIATIFIISSLSSVFGADASLIIGVIIFIIFMVFIYKWYYKE